MSATNVSAIIVTRGDVDLAPILASLPDEWDKIVWDNGERCVLRWPSAGASGTDRFNQTEDLSVYGRYAAIKYARHDLIYVQDDDCVLSDPALLPFRWREESIRIMSANRYDEPVEKGQRHVVCNMPQEFRHDFYRDHCLVGFGAVFHRDAPARAFDRLDRYNLEAAGGICQTVDEVFEYTNFFRRTCDIVFTALTPRVLVDVPKTNLWWAEDETRMYRQPKHAEERTRMLELVRKVRDVD